jgi:transposase
LTDIQDRGEMPREDVPEMDQTTKQRRARREFSAEFRAEVVELCRAGDRSIPQVCRDLDLTESAVRHWVEQAEVDAGRKPGLSSEERAELARLRRENRVLREERDILKRARAFFARETR